MVVKIAIVKRKYNLLHFIVDFFEVSIISATLFAITYIFIGQLTEVSGNSMYPNYLDKEKIIAEKVSIKVRPIKRGEVVIFVKPNTQERYILIKRVIGLPGEIIKLSQGYVYINGEKLDEYYLDSHVNTNEIQDGVLLENTEYEIPSNSYILLGDNRGESTDSRYFGPVPGDNIIARAVIVFYPIDRIRIVK